MANYESIRKWARIYYLIENEMLTEKSENYRKYHLLVNLKIFAFDMYMATSGSLKGGEKYEYHEMV